MFPDARKAQTSMRAWKARTSMHAWKARTSMRSDLKARTSTHVWKAREHPVQNNSFQIVCFSN